MTNLRLTWRTYETFFEYKGISRSNVASHVKRFPWKERSIRGNWKENKIYYYNKK